MGYIRLRIARTGLAPRWLHGEIPRPGTCSSPRQRLTNSLASVNSIIVVFAILHFVYVGPALTHTKAGNAKGEQRVRPMSMLSAKL